MPYNLRLAKKLERLWKVKVQDKEALYEEPHVTIWRRDEKWRYSLRKHRFLDPHPDPGEVPGEILVEIENNYEALCEQWNNRFPKNPVIGEDDDD